MDALKDFFDKTYYHNTAGDWAISLLIILGGVVLAKVLYWIFSNIARKITAKTKTKLDDLLLDMLEEPIVVALIIAGFWIGFSRLTFTDNIDSWIAKVFHVAIALDITWLVARVLDALIQEYLIPLTEKTESDLDDQLLPVLRKGLKTVIWVMGIIIGLNNAGYDVTALIAGLGIGGLALAMAAKDTVSNFFGGITIFTDKPFRMGDRVKVDGFDGMITEIGLRSTRMTTLEGRMVTIPNNKFVDSSIENVSKEPSRKVVLNLGLVYETTPEQMEQAMAILKSIVTDNQSILEENHLVSFTTFGDFSLGILFIYYIKKEADIFESQSTINLEILKRYNEKGLNMAFPTQTLYTIPAS